MIVTYNGLDKNGQPNYGGYSKHIVVDEHYALTVPDGLALEGVAPLLCAGITTYSPLRQWGVGKGRHTLGCGGTWGFGSYGCEDWASLRCRSHGLQSF